MNNGNDTRKSDKVAIKLLEAIKDADLIEHFKNIKKVFGKYDAIKKEGNVLYPIAMREGLYIRNFIRGLGEDEWKWKEKLGLAIMYHENNDQIGSFPGNE